MKVFLIKISILVLGLLIPLQSNFVKSNDSSHMDILNDLLKNELNTNKKQPNT